MIKNILFTIILCSTFIAHSFAQKDSFQLADYTLPNLQFKTWDLSTGLNLRNSDTDRNFTGSSFNNQSTLFNYDLNSFYTYFKNDSTWQKNHSGNLYSSVRFIDQDDQNNSYQSSLSYSVDTDIELVTRKYSSKSNFVEYNLDFTADFSKSKQVDDDGSSNTEIRLFDSNILLLPSIKFGSGRIDQVTDGRWAFIILQRLEREGKLNRKYTTEDIQKFATMLSGISFVRYFDFRLQRISQLEAIDQYLQAEGLINRPDISYFSHLNDMVGFGRGVLRFSGKRSAFMVNTGYLFNNFRRNKTNQLRNHAGLVNIGMEFINDKPINFSLQNTFNSYFLIGFIQGTETEDDTDKNKYFLPKIDIGFSNKIGFYPNTRSLLEFTSDLSFTLVSNKFFVDEESDQVKGFGINGNLQFLYTYFISPRFQIDANIQSFYTKEKIFSDLDVNSFSGNNLIHLMNYQNCNTAYCYNPFIDRKSFITSFTVRIAYSFF